MLNKKDDSLPLERFKAFGVENLTNKELLAIILRTGTKQMNVLNTAQCILEHPYVDAYGLPGLLKLTYEDINSIHGLGQVKTCQLLSIFELSKRIRETSAVSRKGFTSAKEIADYYMDRMRPLQKEYVIGLFLDNKLNKIAEETISIGTINSSMLNPREVYKLALRYNATRIVLVHNHPSGDPNPSKQDKSVTYDFVIGSKILGLSLEDHIIIGDNKYFSMKDMGII